MIAPAMELRRPEEAPPTKVGWYYGCQRKAVIPEVIPWLVIPGPDGTLHAVVPMQGYTPVERMAWFGPVPLCVEAQLP